MNDELTEEKDLELELDGEWYDVTVEYIWGDKFRYGSDLDGNRGEERRELEDCRVLYAVSEDTGSIVENSTILRRLAKLAVRLA